MAQFRFVVGQIVEFGATAQPLSKLAPKGPYKVIRALPTDDVRSLSYRIKSQAEPFERVAREHEIVAVPMNVSVGKA